MSYTVCCCFGRRTTTPVLFIVWFRLVRRVVAAVITSVVSLCVARDSACLPRGASPSRARNEYCFKTDPETRDFQYLHSLKDTSTRTLRSEGWRVGRVNRAVRFRCT
ncbi:hypothetical protein EVAR_97413_1 [Eumeta japonica]|uniref:Uncharacterized protein n=1 Tax=Eumeta variegata TaxID=151549 RepID=A0A4C1WZ58_EUMVA|nr:hypothetical protein EVAR_97413_1 [Eumeta japonica]